MILLETAYPCGKCEAEISPTQGVCPFCGERQSGFADKLIYNVFVPKPGELDLFNMVFGGDPILSMFDLLGYLPLYLQECPDYFIGAYYLGDLTDEGVTVQVWKEVIQGAVTEDNGPRYVAHTASEKKA